MTQKEYNHLLQSVKVLPPEQLQQLRRELDRELGHYASRASDAAGLTAEELADQELQRRLLDAGLLSEIKPPIRDLTPYLNRKAVPVTGEPLSQAVIRERR